MMKFILFVGVLFMIGCSTAKKTVKAPVVPIVDTVKVSSNNIGEDSIENSRKRIVALMNANQTDFKTFSAKIDIESKDNSTSNPNATATLRMIKDSAVWISITATMLNIEVYRALVTKDEIILLDKRARTATHFDVDYLENILGMPFDLEKFQDFILGNKVYFNLNEFSQNASSPLDIQSRQGEILERIIFTNENLFDQQELKLLDKNQSLTQQFSKYFNIDERNFSTERSINIPHKNNLNIKLKFRSVEFNKELSVAFNIPDNYEIK